MFINKSNKELDKLRGSQRKLLGEANGSYVFHPYMVKVHRTNVSQ